MSAMFRICGYESQPSLQLVEKLATPLLGESYTVKTVVTFHYLKSVCKQNLEKCVARTWAK